MTLASITSVLALSSAAVWGAADFSGGMAARHLRVFWLVAISHAFSLTLLLLSAWAFRQPVPNTHALAWGLAAGCAGGMALLAFYYALSLGEMGTTAALTGLLSAAIPVLFTMATIGAPAPRQLLGFAVAAAAIWLISSPQPGRGSAGPDGHRRRKLMLAVISGIGFGIFFIALRQANSGGLVWPLAASRVGSITLALIAGVLFSRGQFTVAPTATGAALVSWRTGVALAFLAGACDTVGNVLFVAATRTGRLDIAAVLASLYPASTILLAAWLLKERTSPRQAVGMAAALVAVALIS
ncbi:MAG: EamA family transporter [Acidobacteriaceae bacterium]